MNLRDLDLVVAGALIAVATVVSRMAEPATAIVVLAVFTSLAILAIGEERLELLWREYSRERAAVSEMRSSRPQLPRRRHPPQRTSTWPVRSTAKLPPARVVVRERPVSAFTIAAGAGR